LTLVIGAAVGLAVVAFILLTENLGARLYPGGGAAWRRLVIPVAGALGTGFFLARYVPNARRSGVTTKRPAIRHALKMMPPTRTWRRPRRCGQCA